MAHGGRSELTSRGDTDLGWGKKRELYSKERSISKSRRCLIILHAVYPHSSAPAIVSILISRMLMLMMIPGAMHTYYMGRVKLNKIYT